MRVHGITGDGCEIDVCPLTAAYYVKTKCVSTDIVKPSNAWSANSFGKFGLSNNEVAMIVNAADSRGNENRKELEELIGYKGTK